MTDLTADPSTGKRARLAFEMSDELAARAETVIGNLRSDDTPKAHVDDLIGVILDLTMTGLNYYFLHPLEIAGVGMIGRGAARIGISAAGKSLPIAVRKVARGMSDDQLRAVADFMDSILIRARG